MIRNIILLIIALVSNHAIANGDQQAQNKDLIDFQRVFKDTGGGGFQFNPNPFFCNSIPQFAPCAQPAIPICCGPCFQSGGQPVAPAASAQPSLPVVNPPGPGGAGGNVPAPPPPASAAPDKSKEKTEAPENEKEGTKAPENEKEGTKAPVATKAPPPENNTANCELACPAGWNQWGPLSKNCYLMPAQPVKKDTFWNHDAYCKREEPTSYIFVVDDLLEQALGTAVALQYAPSWFSQFTNVFLWIGGYTDEKGWKYLDGTDQSSNILQLAANVVGSKKNNTCLGADPKTLGAWQTYPCDTDTGAVICEMAKRPVCGAKGGMLPISPIDLSVEGLKNLFPNMPNIPFLGQLLGGGGVLKGGADAIGKGLGSLAGALGD